MLLAAVDYLSLVAPLFSSFLVSPSLARLLSRSPSPFTTPPCPSPFIPPPHHRSGFVVPPGVHGDDDSLYAFGKSSTPLGDFDNDGVGDVVVGSIKPYPGTVWLLLLNPEGTVKDQHQITPGVTWLESGHDDMFIDPGYGNGPRLGGCHYWGTSGLAVADFDSDGVPDLAVGSTCDKDGGTNRGAVWILFLQSDGTVKSFQKISDTSGGFTGTLTDSYGWGKEVGSIGDLDGDQTPDLVVGTDNSQGAAWVLFLNADGTTKAHQKIAQGSGGFTGTLTDAYFGRSMTAIGDLNQAGAMDIIVGASWDDTGGSRTGAVWVLFLEGDGTVVSHQKISTSAFMPFHLSSPLFSLTHASSPPPPSNLPPPPPPQKRK